jgi:RNA polymerase sigma-70 factor (subfamily 1)
VISTFSRFTHLHDFTERSFIMEPQIFRSEAEWAAVLKQAQAGDAEARNLVCRAFRPYLLSIADEEIKQPLRRKESPSDFVQETLMRAVRDLMGFKGKSPAEFHGWLRQILRRIIESKRRLYAAKKRDIKREQSLDSGGAAAAAAKNVPAPQPPPDLRAQAEERRAREEWYLSHLPRDYQWVLRLRNRMGWTFEDIGREMERSEDAVRMLHQRAMLCLGRLAIRMNERLEGPAGGADVESARK